MRINDEILHSIECECQECLKKWKMISEMHADKPKDKYYYQGKYFDSFDESFKYANEWQALPLDQETANRNLNTFKKEMIMNIFLMGVKMTNSEFNEFLERVFQFALHDLGLKTYKKENEKYDESLRLKESYISSVKNV